MERPRHREPALAASPPHPYYPADHRRCRCRSAVDVTNRGCDRCARSKCGVDDEVEDVGAEPSANLHGGESARKPIIADAQRAACGGAAVDVQDAAREDRDASQSPAHPHPRHVAEVVQSHPVAGEAVVTGAQASSREARRVVGRGVGGDLLDERLEVGAKGVLIGAADGGERRPGRPRLPRAGATARSDVGSIGAGSSRAPGGHPAGRERFRSGGRAHGTARRIGSDHAVPDCLTSTSCERGHCLAIRGAFERVRRPGLPLINRTGTSGGRGVDGARAVVGHRRQRSARRCRARCVRRRAKAAGGQPGNSESGPAGPLVEWRSGSHGSRVSSQIVAANVPALRSRSLTSGDSCDTRPSRRMGAVSPRRAERTAAGTRARMVGSIAGDRISNSPIASAWRAGGVRAP